MQKSTAISSSTGITIDRRLLRPRHGCPPFCASPSARKSYRISRARLPRNAGRAHRVTLYVGHARRIRGSDLYARYYVDASCLRSTKDFRRQPPFPGYRGSCVSVRGDLDPWNEKTQGRRRKSYAEEFGRGLKRQRGYVLTGILDVYQCLGESRRNYSGVGVAGGDRVVMVPLRMRG